MGSEKEAAKSYKRKQIESASPGRLIVMLYDAVLEKLDSAEKILEEKPGSDRIERFHNNMVTAQNIITELTAALDMEKGGEIAKNLFRLYDFANWRLVDANIKKDVSAIREVRQVLEILKAGWEEVQDTKLDDSEVKKLSKGLNLKG